MKKKVVLVTGVGGDIGQSVLKCLNDLEFDFELIGSDVDLYAAGKKNVDHFIQSPWAKNNDKYLDFINRLIKNKGIGYVFPTTESEIKFFDKYRESFCRKNVAIFINNSNIINTFFDKYKTIGFLKRHNLPHPKTYLLEDFRNQLPYPVIIKPRNSWGGKGLILVNDKANLSFLKKRLKDAVAQEIVGIPEEEYTACVFSCPKITFSIVFKRELGYGSLTKVAKLIFDDEVKQLAEKIANFSSLEGSLNIQLRKTKDGYIPFEINPRLSSTVYLRHYFGFKDVKWWICLKQNKKIEFKLNYRNGVGVRTISEAFFDLEK